MTEKSEFIFLFRNIFIGLHVLFILTIHLLEAIRVPAVVSITELIAARDHQSTNTVHLFQLCFIIWEYLRSTTEIFRTRIEMKSRPNAPALSLKIDEYWTVEFVPCSVGRCPYLSCSWKWSYRCIIPITARGFLFLSRSLMVLKPVLRMLLHAAKEERNKENLKRKSALSRE